MPGRRIKKNKDDTEKNRRSRSRTPRRHSDRTENIEESNEQNVVSNERGSNSRTAGKRKSVSRDSQRSSSRSKRKCSKKERSPAREAGVESDSFEQEGQGESQQDMVQMEQDAAAAEFYEDDQVVHFTASGQESEYLSDEEVEPSLQDGENEPDRNSEVTFNTNMMEEGSVNNNATILAASQSADSAKASLGETEKNEIIGEAIGQAVQQVKNLIASSGFLETASMLQEQLKRQELQLEKMNRTQEPVLQKDARIKKKDDACKKGMNNSQMTVDEQELANNSNSEVTVYRNAMIDKTKRVSSSSEEAIDTSDENLIEMETEEIEQGTNNAINQLISDQRKKFDSQQRPGFVNDGQQPSTSGYRRPRPAVQEAAKDGRGRDPEDGARDIIRMAEQSKARVYETPGEVPLMEIDGIKKQVFDIRSDFMHSAMVDEQYTMIGSHLDDNIRTKIEKGEYVDFSKLIGKDRLNEDEAGARYQMIVQNGRQFWAPINDGVQINSFQRWEQAFRVFTNVYLAAHPNRAAELVQYNHLIHMAAQEFMWGNVYRYDKDFRMHLSKFPGRSWSIILQQAWTLRLRDRLRIENGNFHNFNRQDRPDNNNKDRSCRRFNQGKCTYGARCKWDHKCKYCDKWGHGSAICRKLKADKGEKISNSGGAGTNHTNDRGQPDGLERNSHQEKPQK